MSSVLQEKHFFYVLQDHLAILQISRLISWINQSVLVLRILLQANELTDLFTYHEAVKNSSVEMKEVHKKGAGDGRASYSNNTKKIDDCWSESTLYIFTNICLPAYHLPICLPTYSITNFHSPIHISYMLTSDLIPNLNCNIHK